jgi:hypothetical protein
MARRLNLESRLNAVAKRLAPRQTNLHGTIELHALIGWPVHKHDPSSGFKECTEHPPNCAVHITKVAGRLRRLILLDDIGVPPG